MADPYVTVEEVKSRVNGALDSFDAETIAAMVSEFEEIAENYCNHAWVPRTATESAAWDCRTGTILVNHRPVRSVTSLTVDGSTIDLDGVTVAPGSTGAITWTGGYAGTTSVLVYEHGHTEPPQVIKRACIEYVNRTLSAEQSGTSRDVIAQSFDGGITRYSTPDVAAGRPTGWLEVDRLLNSVSRTIAVA